VDDQLREGGSLKTFDSMRRRRRPTSPSFSNKSKRKLAMTAKTNAKASPFAERELTIIRVLNAPRERVFKAWTDPKELAQWWGPKGFTNPVCEVDLKPGGALRIVMRAPDGGEYPMKGIFREIVPPSRLVFTNIAVDKDGNHIIEGLTTVTFADEGGKTKLTLHTSGVAMVDYAAAYLQGMEAGWTQSLEKLEAKVQRAGA
jgi:uncharacterized protein YndB with AHSA1/START domain